MIRSLNIADPNNCVVPWWPKASGLQGITQLTFKPGLNVIYGPNGTGKSTILTTLAKLLCAFQGGRQVVTHTAVRDLALTYQADGKRWLNGVLPDHDGSPVVHFDPGTAVGLIGGAAAFDDDFFAAGVRNAMYKGSSGQVTLERLGIAVQAMHENKWSDLEWRVPQEYALLSKLLAGTGAKECPTILLDEPSRSLDLRREMGLWRLIDTAVERGVQVIIATHSVFPLNREGAHFIETSQGYVQATRDLFNTYYLEPEMRRVLDKQPVDKGSTENPKA